MFGRDEFEWDHVNENHIARHGVDRYEAEDAALDNRANFRRFGTNSLSQRRYVGVGKTEEGRLLFVVVDRKGPSLVRVATARDANFTDKRAYRKRNR